MVTTLFVSIAALCSVPIPNRLSEREVFDCQKYYVKCVRHSDQVNQEFALMDCLEGKKKLGGGE